MGFDKKEYQEMFKEYVKNHRSENGGMKQILHIHLDGPVVLEHVQEC